MLEAVYLGFFSSSSTVKREEIEVENRNESRVDDNDVAEEQSQRKIQPSKGKRYSPAQRKEILEYAQNHSVKEAAEKFGPTETSIYDWRRAIERRSQQGGEGENAGRQAGRDHHRRPQARAGPEDCFDVEAASGIRSKPDSQHAQARWV
jgi:hypothetical protein